MEAKYNPETTDSTYDIYPLLEFVCNMKARMFNSTETEPVIQTVSLPKLCTIETYDELIKYVEDMYVNGMILGDEFVMKPDIDQRRKLINSTCMTLIGSEYPSVDIMRGFHIHTSFGVKIIIK